MNYQVIFSTYNNSTKQEVPQSQLEQELVNLAKSQNIQGFSLAAQTGYWAGEVEKSYTLTIFDITQEQAVSVADELNQRYYQQSSIVKPIQEQVYFIDNPNWGAN